MTPESFGPYRLQSLIGRGGMGEVWRAVDTRHNDRVVALKRLPAELAADPTYRARFQREAAIAASLGDPHVIPIHDYGEIDGRLFIDMRLIEAADLGRMLRDLGALRPEVAVEIVGQVADSLDEAHGRGLLHRDVKPSNVLVAGRPDRPFVYLIDFGIARALEDQGLTSTGAATGTLAYMAPECFDGRPDHRPDRRADVYALACVLHEALTGRPAIEGNSAPSYMRSHLIGPIPRPSHMQPGLPAALDDVIATGLAKDPQYRYQSAGDLARAARAALTARPAPAAGPGYAPTRIGTPTPVPVGRPTPLPPASMPPTPPPPRPMPMPTPAPPARGSRTGWLIAGATTAAALVLAVVVAVVVILPRSGPVTPTSTVAPPPTTTSAATPTPAPTTADATKPTAASVGLTGAYATLYDKLVETDGIVWNTCLAYPEGADATAETAITCGAFDPNVDTEVAFYQLKSRSAYDSERQTYGTKAGKSNCAGSGYGGGSSLDWTSSGAVKGYIACFPGETATAHKIIWASPTSLVEAVVEDTTPATAYQWWTSHAATVPS